MRMTFKPIAVEQGNCAPECEFMLLLQQAVLLALKDRGILTQKQLHLAEDTLRRQYREEISEVNSLD